MKMRKLAYMFCAIAAALGAFVAMARFGNVSVDLRFDPPEIVQDFEFVLGCERLTDGAVAFALSEGAAGFVNFIFSDADGAAIAGDTLGYTVRDFTGAVVASGTGTAFALGAKADCASVTFHSLAGDPFWAASVKIERSETAPVAADSPRLATPGTAIDEARTAPSPLKYERQPNALAPIAADLPRSENALGETLSVAAEVPRWS